MPTPIKSQDRDEDIIYLATGAGIGSIEDPFNPALPTGAATEATLALLKTATETAQAVAGSDSTKATAIQGITGGKDITVSSIDLGIKADSEATDSTSSWSAIALLKGIFKWVKGDRGVGNVSSTTQRVTLCNDGAGVESLSSINARQVITNGINQTLLVGAASVQSSTTNAATKRVVLTTNTDCWFLIGSNPTAVKQTATLATATGIFLPAGGTTYPILVTGGTDKIAVIQDSAGGILSIQESV